MTSHPRSAFTALLAVAAAFAAAPALASGAAIAVDRACYVPGMPIGVTGSGFPPGDRVDVTGEAIFGATNADANGAFAGSILAPSLGTIDPVVKSRDILAVDETTGGITATATFQLTNFTVASSGAAKGGSLSRKIKLKFSGFLDGPAIYGHFLYHHKLKGTHRYGATKGPCGTLTAKAQLIPISATKSVGTWNVQWDTHKKFSKKNPHVSNTVTVYRTFK